MSIPSDDKMHNALLLFRPKKSNANFEKASHAFEKVTTLGHEVNDIRDRIIIMNRSLPNIVNSGNAQDAQDARDKAMKMADMAQKASARVNPQNHMANATLVLAKKELSDASLAWTAAIRTLKELQSVNAAPVQFLQDITNDYKRSLGHYAAQTQSNVIMEANKVAQLATELINSVMEKVKLQISSAKKEKNAAAERVASNNSYLNINNMNGGVHLGRRHSKHNRKQRKQRTHRKRTHRK